MPQGHSKGWFEWFYASPEHFSNNPSGAGALSFMLASSSYLLNLSLATHCTCSQRGFIQSMMKRYMIRDLMSGVWALPWSVSISVTSYMQLATYDDIITVWAGSGNISICCLEKHFWTAPTSGERWSTSNSSRIPSFGQVCWLCSSMVLRI